MHVTHKRSDGRVFVQNLNQIARGSWVVELESVDGDPESGYSDPYPNEREARRGARYFAMNAYHDARYGWCTPYNKGDSV